MLYHLAKYSENQGLSSKPGYSRKKVKAIITITGDGKFLQAEPSNADMMSPSLSQPELISGGKKRSHFLVDTAATVTGIGDDKSVGKHRAFVEIHQEATMYVPELVPLSLALGDENTIKAMAEQLTSMKVKPNDNVTFRLAGLDVCIAEQDTWRNWWDQYRASLRAKQRCEQMCCFITGELVEPVSTHPKLNLSRVGGQSTGSTMIGFDKDSFSSFNLVQSKNASCSAEAAAIYIGALDDLIGKAPKPLANTLMLHWLDKIVPPDENPFGFFSEPMGKEEEEIQRGAAMEAVKRLAEAVRNGERPDFTGNRYHVILISGAAGRAMVRGMFEGELAEIYLHINNWFEDLSIVGPHGGAVAESPQLFALFVRTLPYRPGVSGKDLREEMDKRAAPLAARVWSSILQSAPFPQEAAYKALQYLKSRLLRSREDDRDHSLENIDRIACAMLKLWYNRTVKQGPIESGGEIVEAKLNVEHPAPAYHAGRLLAVLNHLQHAALGDVNADVVQRFFSAASVTPGLVIGRLIDGAQPHLNKLRKEEKMGMYVWYQQMITEIMSRMDDQTLKQLDFSEQTLFALGYYHQSASLFEGRKA